MSGSDLNQTLVISKKRGREGEEKYPLSFTSTNFFERLPSEYYSQICSYLTEKERAQTKLVSRWGASFFKSKVESNYLKQLDKEGRIQKAIESGKLLLALFEDNYYEKINEEYKDKVQGKEYLTKVLTEIFTSDHPELHQEFMMNYLMHSSMKYLVLTNSLPFLRIDLIEVLVHFKQDTAVQYLVEKQEWENFFREHYSIEEMGEMIEDFKRDYEQNNRTMLPEGSQIAESAPSMVSALAAFHLSSLFPTLQQRNKAAVFVHLILLWTSLHNKHQSLAEWLLGSLQQKFPSLPSFSYNITQPVLMPPGPHTIPPEITTVRMLGDSTYLLPILIPFSGR